MIRRGCPMSSEYRAISIAAAPLTCGAAMLVPSRSPQPSRNGAANPLSRCNQIGLDPPVPGRAAAREEADAVRVRRGAVGGADCDDPVGITGVGDAEGGVSLVRSLFGSEALVAEVSGGGDDDDAAVDQALRTLCKREYGHRRSFARHAGWKG